MSVTSGPVDELGNILARMEELDAGPEAKLLVELTRHVVEGDEKVDRVLLELAAEVLVLRATVKQLATRMATLERLDRRTPAPAAT
jgi:hypothetical protein